MKINRKTKRYILRDKNLLLMLNINGYSTATVREMTNRELLSAINAL